MNTTKLFDQFIAQNFQGLSAHTLQQLLSFVFSKAECSNMVYVNVYNVFTKKASEQDMTVYNCIREYVLNIPTSKICLDAGILDLSKVEEYVSLKFTQDDTEYLKESALDWYLNNIITLNQFKLIVAM